MNRFEGEEREGEMQGGQLEASGCRAEPRLAHTTAGSHIDHVQEAEDVHESGMEVVAQQSAELRRTLHRLAVDAATLMVLPSLRRTTTHRTLLEHVSIATQRCQSAHRKPRG